MDLVQILSLQGNFALAGWGLIQTYGGTLVIARVMQQLMRTCLFTLSFEAVRGRRHRGFGFSQSCIKSTPTPRRASTAQSGYWLLSG